MVTKKELQKSFQDLPGDVQDAIVSVDTFEILQTIGKKYKLHVDKIATLGDETGLVMFGVTNPNDFQGNLKRRLEIPEDMARDLVEEINREIFLPIRESLKKIHQIERDEDFKPAPAVEENPPKIMSSEDRKIFSESGIEIQSTINNLQPTITEPAKGIPEKEKILEAIENPKKEAPKGEPLLLAGFTTVAKPALPPSGEITAPDKKLEAPVKMPVSESVYSPDEGNESKTASPQKYSADPYREPIG